MLRHMFFVIICIIIAQSECFSQISTDSLKKHVYFLASDSSEGRYVGTRAMAKCTQYIVENFKLAGIKPLIKDYLQEFPSPPLYGENILGVIEGSDSLLKHEYIVIGAHYDHIGWYINEKKEKIIYNGADDNASGTAAIIEIGRLLAKNSNLLKRSVIIAAFDAEERGLVGSSYFLKNPVVDTNNIKIMMSIDMVGWLKKGKLVFSGCGSFENGLDFMNKIKTVPDLNVRFLNSSFMWKDRTDTKPFYEKRIPCIYVSTGIKSPYHKPEDDADSIDFIGMGKSAEQIYFAALELSAKQDFRFLETRELVRTIKKPFKMGISLSYNSNYHNYSDGPYIAKSLSGFCVGLFSQIEISKLFSVHPEVQYSYYGSKSPLGNIRLSSLEIPLSLSISSPPDIGRAFFELGGFVNYSFLGTIDGKIIAWEKNQFNRTDYGYFAGFGFDIFNIHFGLRYKAGLSNFFKMDIPNTNNGKAMNYTSMLTLGYYF